MNYKFTQEQKDWINKIYPCLTKEYRDQLREIYFKTHYTEKERSLLMFLSEQFRDNDNVNYTAKIPKKDYLGRYNVV